MSTKSPRGKFLRFKIISRTNSTVRAKGVFIEGSGLVEERKKVINTTYLSHFGINKEFFYVHGQGWNPTIVSPANNINNGKVLPLSELLDHGDRNE